MHKYFELPQQNKLFSWFRHIKFRPRASHGSPAEQCSASMNFDRWCHHRRPACIPRFQPLRLFVLKLANECAVTAGASA